MNVGDVMMEEQIAPINPLDYEKLVVYWAKRFGATRPVRDSDEYADGFIALIKAARRYDAGMRSRYTGNPVKFTTYAGLLIRRHLWRKRLRLFAIRRGGTGMGAYKEKRIGTTLFSTMRNDDYGNDWMYDPSNEVESDSSVKMSCEEMLRNLNGRIRNVVELVVMQGMTNETVAKQLGLTKQRVNQIVIGGIKKLRKLFRD